MTLLLALALPLFAAPGEPSLYGISTGRGGARLGDLVSIDARDGTTKILGSLTNHADFTAPNDIVRAADGKSYYVTELEIGEGWARTHLMTVEARSLKVERAVLLGEAFDALVLDASGRLLSGCLDREGSALVSLDPKTGKSTVIGRPGRDLQFTSFALDAHTGKLLGLAQVMRTRKFALVWVDPATGKADSRVDLDLAERPYAMALCADGKARIAGERHTLYEADPATGRTRLLGSNVTENVAGLHAEK